MIYTLTLNPSVDYIVQLEELKLGELNRTTNDVKFPGGKGINVSRVLRQLESKSKALGYIGGFTGAYIEEYLQNENIDTDFVKVNEDTRINVKVKTSKETEINASGPNITEENFEQLITKIQQLESKDLLVLAGSIPSTMPEDTYEKIVSVCAESGTQFVVDAEGELLKKVLRFQPFLIKPNHHELGELFNTSISNPEEVIPFGKKLVEMGARNVIVSLAGEGAVLVNKESAYIAEVPNGNVVNSVGAGDSMVAGFLAAYEKFSNLIEAFRFSVASGSATAFSMGLCTKEDVEKLINQVKIKEI